MSVIMAAPGRVMMVDARRPALWGPLGGSSGGGGNNGGDDGTPADIPGLDGWWDASSMASLADASGRPVAAWGSSIAGVIDQSGGGNPLSVFYGTGSGTPPIATPRLSGLLGGVGRSTVTPPALPSTAIQLPALDPDQGLSLASAQFGSGASWTWLLVWSRPNWRQASGKDAAAVALLAIGTTIVLQADSVGGANRLILFPGASQTVLSSALTRRHTHAAVLRHTPGAGVDVWLDGNQVATGAPNPLAASVSARLLFLHDGTPKGAAQCWFHEAAKWDRALLDTEIATLLAYAGRWKVGARKGVQLLVVGQSNAGNGLNDGAWHLLAQGVAWHLGALAYGVIGLYGSGSSFTCIGGHGIYDVRQPPNTGSPYLAGEFLHNPADGSDPAVYALGADGTVKRL